MKAAKPADFWFFGGVWPLFRQALSQSHNMCAVSMTSGPFSPPYLIVWCIRAASIGLIEWNVPTLHFISSLSITNTSLLMHFSLNYSLMPWVSFWKVDIFLIDRHSTRTLRDLRGNSVSISGWGLGWSRRCLYSVCKSIPNHKTAHSDGECWIYYGRCNLLNCCLCPFVIINQRAAGQKSNLDHCRVIPLLSLW